MPLTGTGARALLTKSDRPEPFAKLRQLGVKLSDCREQVSGYSRCLQGLLPEVNKGACEKEFQALKICFQVRMTVNVGEYRQLAHMESRAEQQLGTQMSSLEDVEATLYRKHQQLVSQTSASLASAQQVLQQATDTNLDMLVSRNIQDVIASVSSSYSNCNNASNSAELALEPLKPTLTKSSSIAKRGASPARVMSQRVGSTTAATTSSKPLATAAVQPSFDSEQPSVLDVAEHPAATIRLHKARVNALEQQVVQLTDTLHIKEKDLSGALSELQSLRAEKASWGRTQKNLELQVAKQRQAMEEAQTAVASRDQQLLEARKGSSQTDQQRRRSDADARTKSVQLTRALEEVEHYKKLLQEVKLQDKDGKSGSREDMQRLMVENKKLERQRAQLVVAFKKQLKLIDVLKRQKIHMEAARALAFTEEEFLKALDIGSV